LEGWSDWQPRVWGGPLESLDAPEQAAKLEGIWKRVRETVFSVEVSDIIQINFY